MTIFGSGFELVIGHFYQNFCVLRIRWGEKCGEQNRGYISYVVSTLSLLVMLFLLFSKWLQIKRSIIRFSHLGSCWGTVCSRKPEPYHIWDWDKQRSRISPHDLVGKLDLTQGHLLKVWVKYPLLFQLLAQKEDRPNPGISFDFNL